MIFEAALFDRCGGKTWFRVILACGLIHRSHISAVNDEVKRRTLEHEGRQAAEKDADLPPASHEAKTSRPQRQTPVGDSTDCWDGAVDKYGSPCHIGPRRHECVHAGKSEIPHGTLARMSPISCDQMELVWVLENCCKQCQTLSLGNLSPAEGSPRPHTMQAECSPA